MQYIILGKSLHCSVVRQFAVLQSQSGRQADGGSGLRSFIAAVTSELAPLLCRRGARLIKTHAERASEREADIFAPTEERK